MYVYCFIVATYYDTTYIYIYIYMCVCVDSDSAIFLMSDSLKISDNSFI